MIQTTLYVSDFVKGGESDACAEQARKYLHGKSFAFEFLPRKDDRLWLAIGSFVFKAKVHNVEIRYCQPNHPKFVESVYGFVYDVYLKDIVLDYYYPDIEYKR